jgi:hypothetical protein
MNLHHSTATELRAEAHVGVQQLREKDRQLQQKDRDLKRKDQELTRKTEQAERSKQPVKTFIVAEIRKSYKSVAEAKHAHATAPSKYSAGLIELAKGSHTENEETFKRLADVVGIDFNSLDLKLEELEIDEKPNGVLDAVVKQEKKVPREVSILVFGLWLWMRGLMLCVAIPFEPIR